jgi:drug/metabolite transporter (DMT)-like permease
MSDRIQAYVGSIIAAFLFGATFVVVKEAVVSLPPLSFVGSTPFEGSPIPPTSVLPALIGTGVIIAAGAFLLQVRAQKVIGPSRRTSSQLNR